jgi:hypothetical protein
VSGRPAARVCLLAAAALMAFGCGSDGSSDESQQLPAEVADDLAGQSDAVEATLAAGDDCAARDQAIALRQDVRRAVDEGQVPASLEAEMRRRANDLVGSIHCEPPPEPPPPAPPPPPPAEYEEEDD